MVLQVDDLWFLGFIRSHEVNTVHRPTRPNPAYGNSVWSDRTTANLNASPHATAGLLLVSSGNFILQVCHRMDLIMMALSIWHGWLAIKCGDVIASDFAPCKIDGQQPYHEWATWCRGNRCGGRRKTPLAHKDRLLT
jgi:hypothetical protein